MIRGGIPTVFVSDMDRSVAFYTEVLGLALAFRAGDQWASIDAGDGTTIGLHPRSDQAPEPGAVGAISVGLNVDEPIDGVIATLEARGVEFPQGVSSDGMLKIAHFADPDGNRCISASSRSGARDDPLSPGEYTAKLLHLGPFPSVASAAVTVVPRT